MQAREVRDFWLVALKSEGARPDTLRSYREHSDLLLRHLGERELSPFTIRAFLSDYADGHANASLRTVFTSIRAWLRWAARESLLPEAVLTGLRPPKKEDAPKRVYASGQLQALFRILEAERTPLGLRDYALVALLADTGLRATEACSVTLAHLQDGAISIRHSKGRRPRSVFLGRAAEKAVARYLASGRPRLRPRCEALLVSQDGTEITRNTVRLALNRLSVKVGFKLSAHRFRHTWTTLLLRRGADLETLRQLGGWADYSVIKTYAHLADGDLRAAQERLSPLDGLRL